MRFMMIVKANKDTEAGVMPEEKLIAAMAQYNEELAQAGVLIDGAGLQPSSKGARVTFSGGKRSVVDGPFAETKELIAGYWLIQVKSKQEAIEWAKRAPAPHGERAEGRSSFASSSSSTTSPRARPSKTYASLRRSWQRKSNSRTEPFVSSSPRHSVAKAGVQGISAGVWGTWVPAFAGMTNIHHSPIRSARCS